MAKNIITGIDVGSSKICTVIASFEDDIDSKPQVIGTSIVESKGIKRGVVINIEQAVTCISDSLELAEKMSGLTVSSVIVSVNGSHIASINNKGVIAVANRDEISKDDVERAVESAKTVAIPNSREIIHVLEREYVVDSLPGIRQPIGMSGTRLEVDTHIISAVVTATHNLKKPFEQIRINLDTTVFTGYASAESVLTNTEKELGVMLLDIGAGTTSITIYEDDAICYSGCVPYGGSLITTDLASILRLSTTDAEKLKINFGKIIDLKNKKTVIKSDSPSFLRKDSDAKVEEKKDDFDGDTYDVKALNLENIDSISKRMFDEIVEARLEDIFEFVVDEVTKAGYEYKQPAGIVITGGTANLYNISKIIQKHLGVPARIGTPHALIGMTDEIESPEFSVVQGLILRGMNLESEIGTSGGPSKVGSTLSSVFGWFKKFAP
ncbi:MAG: cell division protein FtsA [bacterium]